MWISNGPLNGTIQRTVGTGGTSRGSICVMSSDTAVKGAAAPTAATVFGIACATYAATDVGNFSPIDGNTIIGAKYTGSSKTSLTDADLGKVFDLSDSLTVNLDDTTGGCCQCEGYNNTTKTIYFKVVESFLK